MLLFIYIRIKKTRVEDKKEEKEQGKELNVE
jgi:hypothetical protein